MDPAIWIGGAFFVVFAVIGVPVLLWAIGTLANSYRNPRQYNTEFRPFIWAFVILVAIVVGALIWGIVDALQPLFNR